MLASLSLNAMAQSNTDKNSAEKTNSESPVMLLNEANKLAETNASKSMDLATKALEKSLKQKDKISEFHAYNTLGTLYFNIGNYGKAKEYFTRSFNGFTELKNKKGQAYAEKYLALSLEKLKEYEEALKLREVSSKTYSKNEKANPKLKYEKARLKSRSGKKEEAIDDLEELTRQTNVKKETKIDIYNELGDLYAEKNDTVEAYNTYWKVLELDKPVSERSSNSNSNKRGYLDAANKISEINIKEGKVDENIRIQNQLLMDGLRSKDINLMQTANFNLGTSYLQQNLEVKAIPYLFTSAKLAKKSGNALEEQRSVKELASAYEKIGEFDKALDIYKRYVHLSDSFRNLQQGNEEASLALNREFLKQEKRIKNLLNTQKQKEASLKRQRNIVWALTGVLFVFALLTWSLVRNIDQKKKANMVIKLQSLRTQMNPHFIFNSLNSVNNFISKNDERSANKYLADFSKLMRTVLKNSDQDFISLATEIDTLKIYLDLEHFRFGDKFDYELEIAAGFEPESVKIPPMLIQPYIENAIWHGLRYKEDKGFLEIKFFTENNKLYCTVQDNGIGRKKSSELKTQHQKTYQSTGIKNSKERMEILNKLHKTSLGITITDIEDEGTGTFVKIELPYILNDSDV